MRNKLCTKCGVKKNKEEFANDCRKDDGLNTWCRECCAIANKKRYDANPEKYKKRQREYNKTHKEYIRESNRKYYEKNAAECIAYSRKWYKNNKEKAKDTNLKYTYGISLEDYNKILRAQNYVCAICGNPRGAKNLFVEHCHSTGEVRGLVCHSCNYALGYLHDDVTRARKLLEYLLGSNKSSVAHLAKAHSKIARSSNRRISNRNNNEIN
jgi:hypothetical protein